MGHFLADQKYGVNASCTSEQSDANGHEIDYCPNSTNHPHLNVLEYFVPTSQYDPFKWIPKGLFYDLMDNGEPFIVTQVDDQVTGYSVHKIFTAMQADVLSVPLFKARFVQQNNINPQTSINNLFTSYAY